MAGARPETGRQTKRMSRTLVCLADAREQGSRGMGTGLKGASACAVGVSRHICLSGSMRELPPVFGCIHLDTADRTWLIWQMHGCRRSGTGSIRFSKVVDLDARHGLPPAPRAVSIGRRAVAEAGHARAVRAGTWGSKRMCTSCAGDVSQCHAQTPQGKHAQGRCGLAGAAARVDSGPWPSA